MTEAFYANMQRMLDGNPAVEKIAGNPIIAAELLLLFRMILADGVIEKSEIEVFRRICRQSFGIDEDAFHDVVRYLNFFCTETSDPQALGVFRTLDDERKKSLIRHMVEIAGADNELHPKERSLLLRALEVLGYQGDAA